MNGRAKKSPYRGSMKHKNRPAEGAKGTLCPEWTHLAEKKRLENDPFGHDWLKTEAHQLFSTSEPHPEGEERRYATKNGIAFEAKPTNDETWHGYPVPWKSVPTAIMNAWIDNGQVTRKQIKTYMDRAKNDIHWALDSDE